MATKSEENIENLPVGKISTKERLGYGLGDLATNLAWASLGMFITYFYTDVIGIAAGTVGTILLLSRFLDGISDVVMGTLVDNTSSKHGKARPWILWLAIPFGVLTAALFAVPDTSYTIQIIYVIISYNLLVLAFTGIVIPYGTLNSLITQDKHEREVLNVYRMFLAQIGVLIVTNLTMPLIQSFGGGQSGWMITYSIFGGLAILLFIVTFKTTKERVVPAKNTQEKLPLKISLKTLTQNKYWIIAFLFFIIYSIGYGLNQGATVFYAETILGHAGLVGPLTLAYLIPVLIGFIFLPKLLEKYGKRNTMIVGSIISIIGLFINLINPYNTVIVAFSQIIKGFGQVPLLGGLWALLPDTIEYGEWKTGIRNEGLLYSGGSMGQKVGVGLGSAILGWVLSAGGYIGGQIEQPETAVNAIFILFIYLPIIVFFIQIILLYFYKLDKIYPKIESDLAKRHSEN